MYQSGIIQSCLIHTQKGIYVIVLVRKIVEHPAQHLDLHEHHVGGYGSVQNPNLKAQEMLNDAYRKIYEILKN